MEKNTKIIEELNNKELRIKKHYNKLKKVFKTLDENKKVTVETLIQRAAFITITLEDLERVINEQNNYSEEYQNGENQKGRKQSAEIQSHISMTKNLTTIIKQLNELVPVSKKGKSKLALLRDE